MSLFAFFFFLVCWNKGYCPSWSNYTHNVMGGKQLPVMQTELR